MSVYRTIGPLVICEGSKYSLYVFEISLVQVHIKTREIKFEKVTILNWFCSLYPPQNEVLGGYTVFSLSVIP